MFTRAKHVLVYSEQDEKFVHQTEKESAQMSSPTRRRILVRTLAVLSATVIVATLSGCARAGTASTSASLGDTGKEVDNVTVALPGSLSNLYTGIESGILNYNIAALTQEGLVGLDSSGNIVPALATSWTQPDSTTYVYELRDDAKFQNGDAVTAEDVAFSITEAQDATLSPNLAYYLSDVTSVEVTGEHEVTIKLSGPNAAFQKNMSVAGAAFITQKKFWQNYDGKVGTSTSLLLGTGPYKVTSFTPDSGLTLERVDTWWGGVPKVKKITVKFITDENTRYLAAQSGDVDVAFNVPVAQVSQWNSLADFRVEKVNDLSYVGLNFDTRVAPFDDENVRKAIAYAIDKDTIVTNLLQGNGEVATSIATPESLQSVYSADDARAKLASITQYDYDLTEAKAALAASSHPDGFTAELTYPSTGPQLGTAAQAIAQSLKEIGITLKVTEKPISEWLATLGDGTHGIGYMWYFSTTGDPAEVPAYLLSTGNISGFENADVQSLLTQAGSETDASKRIDLIIQAEQIQADNAINVPLWWGKSLTAFSNKIGLADYSAFSFVTSWGASLYSAG